MAPEAGADDGGGSDGEGGLMAFDRVAYYRARRKNDPVYRAKEAERHRRHYAEHREERIARTARWKAKNRARYLAYMRKYNAADSARKAALRARERAKAVYQAWWTKGVEE